MEIYNPDSRVGKFNIPHECDAETLQALLKQVKILQVENHESGRGVTFMAVSSLFQALTEGEEIPEYRITVDKDGFKAIRNTIIRVPTINMFMSTHI